MKRKLLGLLALLLLASFAHAAEVAPDPRAMALERASFALGLDDAQKALFAAEIARLPVEPIGAAMQAAAKRLLAGGKGAADEAALLAEGEKLLDELAAKEHEIAAPLMAMYRALNDTQRRIVAAHLERGPRAGKPGAREGMLAGRRGKRGKAAGGDGEPGDGPKARLGKRGPGGPFAGAFRPDPEAMKAIAAKVRDGALDDADIRAALAAWREKARVALPEAAKKMTEFRAKRVERREARGKKAKGE